MIFVLFKKTKRGVFKLTFDINTFILYQKHKWYVHSYKNKNYLIRSKYNPNKTIRFHREIMELKDSKLEVDHIDGDGLNNSLINLRLCTHIENQQNRKPQNRRNPDKFKNIKHSDYKGVSWNTHNKKWASRITFNKKLRFLGYFDNEIDAAKAYNVAAQTYFKEFSKLNEGI